MAANETGSAGNDDSSLHIIVDLLVLLVVLETFPKAEDKHHEEAGAEGGRCLLPRLVEANDTKQ
jgi:hypothetical protein